jgi:hypothetical protein
MRPRHQDAVRHCTGPAPILLPKGGSVTSPIEAFQAHGGWAAHPEQAQGTTSPAPSEK